MNNLINYIDLEKEIVEIYIKEMEREDFHDYLESVHEFFVNRFLNHLKTYLEGGGNIPLKMWLQIEDKLDDLIIDIDNSYTNCMLFNQGAFDLWMIG